MVWNEYQRYWNNNKKSIRVNIGIRYFPISSDYLCNQFQLSFRNSSIIVTRVTCEPKTSFSKNSQQTNKQTRYKSNRRSGLPSTITQRP